MVQKIKLDEKLLRLNTLGGVERKELKELFLEYSKTCGLCTDCLVKYNIISIYESKFVYNLGRLYDRAEQFVNFHYLRDNK